MECPGGVPLYVHVELLWHSDCFFVPLSSTSLNFSINVRTELGTDFKIPAEASLFWPHLFTKQTLEFSPTTIGNSTVSDLPSVINYLQLQSQQCMFAIQPDPNLSSV